MAKRFSRETYLYWYELMQLIRRFELAAESIFKSEDKIRGVFHSYVGQEAIAAGCMTATKAEDNFITGHRNHGLAIAKGVSVRSCMAELFGKATGNAKGKGGSMHFFGKDVRFWGGQGIVGAQIGTGAGLAFAEKYKDTDNVTLSFFGDAALHQGIFHETLNMASRWKLPVVFICENNSLSIENSGGNSQTDIFKLADSYEMPADEVDGTSPEIIHEAAAKAVKKARAGEGPSLIEIKTFGYNGDIASISGNDPIEKTKAFMLANKIVLNEEIGIIDNRVEQIIQDAINFANESPYPQNDEVLKDIYAEPNYPFITD